MLIHICQQATLQTFDRNSIGDAVKFVMGFEGDTYADNVLEYNFTGRIEVGSRRNLAVHSHSTLMFRHDSRIHLDRNVLVARFLAAWNAQAPDSDKLQRVYLNIAAASNNVANLLLYQMKDEGKFYSKPKVTIAG